MTGTSFSGTAPVLVDPLQNEKGVPVWPTYIMQLECGRKILYLAIKTIKFAVLGYLPVVRGLYRK